MDDGGPLAVRSRQEQIVHRRGSYETRHTCTLNDIVAVNEYKFVAPRARKARLMMKEMTDGLAAKYPCRPICLKHGCIEGDISLQRQRNQPTNHQEAAESRANGSSSRPPMRLRDPTSITNIWHPIFSIYSQLPASDIQLPASSFQLPACNIWNPRSNLELPASSVEHPPSRVIGCRLGRDHDADAPSARSFAHEPPPNVSQRSRRPSGHMCDGLFALAPQRLPARTLAKFLLPVGAPGHKGSVDHRQQISSPRHRLTCPWLDLPLAARSPFPLARTAQASAFERQAEAWSPIRHPSHAAPPKRRVDDDDDLAGPSDASAPTCHDANSAGRPPIQPPILARSLARSLAAAAGRPPCRAHACTRSSACAAGRSKCAVRRRSTPSEASRIPSIILTPLLPFWPGVVSRRDPLPGPSPLVRPSPPSCGPPNEQRRAGALSATLRPHRSSKPIIQSASAGNVVDETVPPSCDCRRETALVGPFPVRVPVLESMFRPFAPVSSLNFLRLCIVPAQTQPAAHLFSTTTCVRMEGNAA
ncbi:hypothetical protein RJ55_02927 [Drechmeria coniospora]|nr:hypothetical protein RJ55_02927 [Drechmeria coniospora]